MQSNKICGSTSPCINCVFSLSFHTYYIVSTFFFQLSLLTTRISCNWNIKSLCIPHFSKGGEDWHIFSTLLGCGFLYILFRILNWMYIPLCSDFDFMKHETVLNFISSPKNTSAHVTPTSLDMPNNRIGVLWVAGLSFVFRRKNCLAF